MEQKQLNTDLITVFLKSTGLLDDPAKAEIKQQAALDEELDEYTKALEAKEGIALLDAIGDCCFIINTLIILVPHKGYEFMYEQFCERHGEALVGALVHRVSISNLTKFDTTLEDAEDTQASYASLGLETEIKHIDSFYIVRSSKDQKDINGKFIFEGKVLKSKSRFVDVTLEDLLPQLSF